MILTIFCPGYSSLKRDCIRSVRLARRPRSASSISRNSHRVTAAVLLRRPSVVTSSSTIHEQRRSLSSEYAGNDGVIEGVWMFTRHGDRSPSRPMSPEHRRDEESAFWVSKLPVPNSWQVLQDFATHFPIQTDNQFLELKRNPYGFLTEKGLHQLNEHGKRFRARYLRHGLKESERGLSFEQLWTVKAYSTGYLRTVLSVQSFLSGLFNVPRGPLQPPRKVDPNQPKEYWPDSLSTDAPTRSDQHGSAIVSVIVRDIQEDPLNAFDRHPELMERLSAEVMSSDSFRYHDGNAAPLAARLANHLPGLVKDRTSDYAAMSPSGINWIDAADHFICRTSHDLPLAKFSDHEKDIQAEATLRALSHPTLAHLSWRFRQWYDNKALLATVAAPPLREILHQIETTAISRPSSRRPFVIYSCHDITILGILYAINAEVLQIDERFWPPYGSHLAFELVRCGDKSHVIRIVLNGQSLRSLEVRPGSMLRIDDAMRIVSKLETSGGPDYNALST